MSSDRTQDLRHKLRADLGTGRWVLLAPHAGRGALILVARELELLDVAVAIAKDETSIVRGWLEAGHLRKPAQADLERFDGHQQTFFQFVVVSPFVVAKEISTAHVGP